MIVPNDKGVTRRGFTGMVMGFAAMAFSGTARANALLPACRMGIEDNCLDASRGNWPRSEQHIMIDLESGVELSGHGVDTPRENASTTKIMTAYLVLKTMKSAAVNGYDFSPQSMLYMPAITQSPLHYTNARSLWSGGRTGFDVITIDDGGAPVTGVYSADDYLEAMCGDSCFMASTALAVHTMRVIEHQREMARTGRSGLSDPYETAFDQTLYDMFVVEMNKTAAELGMNRTQFKDAVGKPGPEDDAFSTPRDMARLVRAFYEEFPEEFERYFGQGRYTLESHLKDSNPHSFAHTSTNVRNHEGEVMGKTGTTDDAGSCFAGIRRFADGRKIIGVIFGASGSGNRERSFMRLTQAAYNKARELMLGHGRPPRRPEAHEAYTSMRP